MKLLIIRHAESANNRLGHQMGHDDYMRQRFADPPLTQLGERQAGFAAEHLAQARVPEHAAGRNTQQANPGYAISHLYCSAMKRSLQTAQPIGQALGMKPEIWIDIHEHGGLFQGDPRGENGVVSAPGLTRREIEQDFPSVVVGDAVSDDGWWRDGHEDMPGCYARATRVAHDLRERAAQGPDGDDREFIAIVSHGTFIDCLLKALFKQIPERHLFYLHYNTAITRVDFRPDGVLLMRYLNRTEHLTPAHISY